MNNDPFCNEPLMYYQGGIKYVWNSTTQQWEEQLTWRQQLAREEEDEQWENDNSYRNY